MIIQKDADFLFGKIPDRVIVIHGELVEIDRKLFEFGIVDWVKILFVFLEVLFVLHFLGFVLSKFLNVHLDLFIDKIL